MNKNIHYAWYIALGCGMVMFYSLGLGFNCISVFLNPLMESIGVNNTLRSSITMFYQSGSVLALLAVAPLMKRFGARRVIFVSGICMAAGYLLLSIAGSVLACYGAMLVIGIGYGAGAIVPCSALLTIWFSEKRGFALGLVTCGSGIATIFAPSILNGIITIWSVQTAFFIHGILIGGFAWMAFLILRDHPQDKGLRAYGEEAEDEDEEETVSYREVGFLDCIKDHRIVLMMLSILAVGTIISPMVTHLSPIVSQSGYDEELAAKAVSVYGFSMLIGKPAYGAIVDKLGVIRSNTYVYGFLLIAMIFGLFADQNISFAFGLAILFGLGGAPVIPVGLPLWTSKLFGKENMGGLFAMLKLCSSLGGILGAMIPGMVMDRTGSYDNLFQLYIVMLALSYGVIQYLFLRKRKTENEK
ncbi:MAG: MFS transporter [Firmicutes bacterium]|nr:MFS transporter [Bacillota bacterium]